MKDLTIILPTFNEEQNIEFMIKEIKKLDKDIKIIVIDDGSTDNTQKLVLKYKKDNVYLINRTNEDIKGLTVSACEGILYTMTKYFIVMDADTQHPIDKIKEFYERLPNYFLVIGARYKVICDWPWQRKLMSKIGILLANIRLLMVGKYYKDVMSGFFGGNTALISQVIISNKTKFELKGYKVLFDILKYMPNIIKVGYVYYNFGLRTKGTSKIGKKQIISLIKAILK